MHALTTQLVAEKEFLITMLTTSHDLHLLRIDTREDTLVRRSSDWVTTIIDDMHDRVEMARNRERVCEICHFVESVRDEVAAIEEEVVVQPLFSEEFMYPDQSNVQRVDAITTSEPPSSRVSEDLSDA